MARGLEYEPRYVDVAIVRWQKVTKLEATLAGDGRSFEDIADARSRSRESPRADRTRSAVGQSRVKSAGDGEDLIARAAEGDRPANDSVAADMEGDHD